MKKKQLEILLQKIPDFEKPLPELEQYITPATIAADIVFNAHQYGDIQNKKIIDLGCGTGIFSFGAALTNAKKVTGYDIDKNSIKIAEKYAKENKIDVEFKIKEISKIKDICDTVIMNPPFGAQKSNIKADRKFIEKAFEISDVIYSIHLSKTIPFIEKMIFALKGEHTYSKDYTFPIKHSFDFHKKNSVNYDVTLIRIYTKNK